MSSMKRNSIKLFENKLNKIVKEAINNVFKPNLKTIDISKIDINILRKNYIDFRLVPSITTYDNFLSNLPHINESFGDILPPDNVVSEIRQKYNLDSQLVLKVETNNDIHIYVITACIGINEQLIEDDMKKMGYFLSCKGEVQKIENMYYQTLQFEPYSQMQNNETLTIKYKYDFLYHWTPKYHLNDILKNGLKPDNKNSKFNYPNRVYLMKGDSDLNEMLNLGKLLSMVNNDYRNNGQYVLLKIDITDLSKDLKFYYDSNTSIGIYTEQPIPKKYITVLFDYDFST